MIYGTRKGAADCGVKVTLADPITSDTQIDDVVDYVETTLRNNPEIDAIVTASTSSAMGAVAGLEKTGAQVGREIDVSTKEAIPFLKLFRADILTTTEKVGAAGEFLARAAIQAIRSPLTTPMQHLEIPSAQDS
jgi:LacI family transcriptional regulator